MYPVSACAPLSTYQRRLAASLKIYVPCRKLQTSISKGDSVFHLSAMPAVSGQFVLLDGGSMANPVGHSGERNESVQYCHS
jgi:hypothetical protein